jgi:hypothetical protein
VTGDRLSWPLRLTLAACILAVGLAGADAALLYVASHRPPPPVVRVRDVAA